MIGARTQVQHAEVSFTDLGFDFTFQVIDSSDIIQRQYVVGKLYERAELQKIRSLIEPGSHVLDIGANVGNHSIFFAKLGARVLSFEADPYTVEILRKNVELNEVGDRVLVLNLGLSDRAETLGIWRRNHNLGATRLSLERIHQRKMTLEYGAECIPLDSISFDRVDFVKIDVEQMELKVLHGATETLAKHRPIVFIEVHDSLANDVQEWCHLNLYEPTPVNENTGAAYGNWLLRPQL